MNSIMDTTGLTGSSLLEIPREVQDGDTLAEAFWDTDLHHSPLQEEESKSGFGDYAP